MEEKLTMKQLLAILAAGLFSFCGVLIETATNITFPTLMNEFHISTSLVQWMTTGNLLMMGIMIPISSYLKRRFQTKKLFLIAGFLFSIGLPSQANYFLCEVISKYSSKELTELLLNEYNILIKDCGTKKAFRNGEYIRIAVRSTLDNQRLIDALKEL